MENVRSMTNDEAFSSICDHIRISQIRFESMLFMATVNQFFETMQTQCKVALEIGSEAGGNLTLLSKLVSDDGIIISIDPGHFGMRENEAMIREAIAPVRLVYIDGLTTDPDMEERLRAVTGHVDLVFIDGDHKAVGVQHDYTTILKYVRRPGIVAFHDITLDVFIAEDQGHPMAAGYTGHPMVKQYWDSVVKRRVAYTEIVSNEPGRTCTTGIGAVFFT